MRTPEQIGGGVMPDPQPRLAELFLDGWAGRRSQPVLIVGETPKRYRIRTTTAAPVRLAGRRRWLFEGETVLVPKTAVRVDD